MAGLALFHRAAKRVAQRCLKLRVVVLLLDEFIQEMLRGFASKALLRVAIIRPDSGFGRKNRFCRDQNEVS